MVNDLLSVISMMVSMVVVVMLLLMSMGVLLMLWLVILVMVGVWSSVSLWVVCGYWVGWIVCIFNVVFDCLFVVCELSGKILLSWFIWCLIVYCLMMGLFMCKEFSVGFVLGLFVVLLYVKFFLKGLFLVCCSFFVLVLVYMFFLFVCLFVKFLYKCGWFFDWLKFKFWWIIGLGLVWVV